MSQHVIERSEEHPDIITVNMGPSHPATHGVLRIVLKLDGETVVKAVPHIGYLHRGMEKIAENRTYLQFLPYTDRMDYLAPLAANVGFSLAVEELLGVEVPPRCQAIRVLCCELALIGDLTGARLTTSYTRVGGVTHDADRKWLADLRRFVDEFPRRVDEYESLL